MQPYIRTFDAALPPLSLMECAGWHLNRFLVVALSAVLQSCSGPAGNNATGSRVYRKAAPLRHMILSGIVTSLGVVQEEPGETPQATFYLKIIRSNGTYQNVLVGLPESRFLCVEGDHAKLEGDLSPGKTPSPPILLSAKLLSCNGKTPEP